MKTVTKDDAKYFQQLSVDEIKEKIQHYESQNRFAVEDYRANAPRGYGFSNGSLEEREARASRRHEAKVNMERTQAYIDYLKSLLKKKSS